MKTKKGKTPPLNDIKLSQDEVNALEQRIRASNLAEADQDLLVSLVSTVITLRALVLRGKAGLFSLLRKIFGAKTEKQKKSPKKVILKRRERAVVTL